MIVGAFIVLALINLRDGRRRPSAHDERLDGTAIISATGVTEGMMQHQSVYQRLVGGAPCRNFVDQRRAADA